MFEHAFVIGKFLPPHVGHMIMINTAANLAKRVTVVVEQQDDEPISVDVRQKWLQQSQTNNNVTVVPLYGSHPASPPEDVAGQTKFWAHWKKIISDIAPDIDVVVSADDYGARLAQDQNASWWPVDRNTFPISATLFKKQPWDRFQWLVPAAQHALTRRLLVVGAESTGKTIMGQRLAQTAHVPTIVVPEYAEHWIRRKPGVEWDEDALTAFLHGQQASRCALLPLANRWMVEDSHALTTAVWAEYLGHHELANTARLMAQNDAPHHVIFSSIEGAVWKSDAHRPTQSHLEFFERRFVELLDDWNWPYSVVKGSWDERTQQSILVRDQCLEEWSMAPWSEWTKNPSSTQHTSNPPSVPNL